MNSIKPSVAVLPWVFLLVLSLIWGSSFILMKKSLEVFSYTQVAALRIFIAFIFIIPFTIKGILSIPRKYWGYMTLAGYLGNGIPPFLFTKAQTYLSSSMAGVLNALTPLFTFVIGILWFNAVSKWYRFLGVMLGLAGAAGLLLLSNGSPVGNFSYGLYIVVATICYALATNIVKRYLQDVNALHMSGFFFLVTGVPLGIYLFTATEFVSVMQNVPGASTSLIYVSILAVFGSAISLVMWNKLIQTTNAVFAASVTYIMPVFAIIWGVLDGEDFLISYLPMIALVMFGVYLTNRK